MDSWDIFAKICFLAQSSCPDPLDSLYKRPRTRPFVLNRRPVFGRPSACEVESQGYPHRSKPASQSCLYWTSAPARLPRKQGPQTARRGCERRVERKGDSCEPVLLSKRLRLNCLPLLTAAVGHPRLRAMAACTPNRRHSAPPREPLPAHHRPPAPRGIRSLPDPAHLRDREYDPDRHGTMTKFPRCWAASILQSHSWSSPNSKRPSRINHALGRHRRTTPP